MMLGGHRTLGEAGEYRMLGGGTAGIRCARKNYRMLREGGEYSIM